ncbi:MAG: MIP/aquaporin family protein, partial [Verrucomicrobiota bacterium]
MNAYVAEFIGTAILILFGNGVVANVVLQKTKGFASGWIVITTGWGLAVMIAAYSVGTISGAHLNPALTIALAITGKFALHLVPGYILAQFTGAFTGAVLVYLAYLPHWSQTPDPASKLAAFST